MSRWIRIAFAAGLAVCLVGAVAGCGKSPDLNDIDEGQSFELKDVRFNVLYDRFLNPGEVEDASYLQGEPPPPAGTEYFGVFVLLKNLSSDDTVGLGIDDFTIEDTLHNRYSPINSTGPFAFPFGATIPGDSEIPDPDSIAASGPTQGSLLLFSFAQGITENRPLEMTINYLGESAKVKLDL